MPSIPDLAAPARAPLRAGPLVLRGHVTALGWSTLPGQRKALRSRRRLQRPGHSACRSRDWGCRSLMRNNKPSRPENRRLGRNRYRPSSMTPKRRSRSNAVMAGRLSSITRVCLKVTSIVSAGPCRCCARSIKPMWSCGDFRGLLVPPLLCAAERGRSPWLWRDRGVNVVLSLDKDGAVIDWCFMD